MGDLTENFSLHEFRSRRSNTHVPRELWSNVLMLARELEVIRAVRGTALSLTSGYRTLADHEAIYREMGRPAPPGSQHLVAKAADFEVQGISPTETYCAVVRLIERGSVRNGGLGWYGPNHPIHYDIESPRRWTTVGSYPDCSRYQLPSQPTPAPQMEEEPDMALLPPTLIKVHPQDAIWLTSYGNQDRRHVRTGEEVSAYGLAGIQYVELDRANPAHRIFILTFDAIPIATP